MKSCKGNCGRTLNLLQPDYCDECYNGLDLREKVCEEIRKDRNLNPLGKAGLI